jgi:hypothetical protein
MFAHNMEIYLYKRNFENKIGEWCSPEILIQGMLQEPVFDAQTCKVFGAEFEETSLQLALDQETSSPLACSILLADSFDGSSNMLQDHNRPL